MERTSARRFALVLLSVSLMLLTTTLVVLGQPVGEKPESTSTSQVEDTLPIFDFENYKRLFRRHYSGLEEVTRRNYFIARAIRVAIVAIKYREGEMLHYFAINCFSDATLEELDMMRNRVADDELSTDDQRQGSDTKLQKPDLKWGHINWGDDIEANLRQLVSNNPNELALKELREFLDTSRREEKERRKRDVSSEKKRGKRKRHLPMSKLISTGEGVDLRSDRRAKMVTKLPEENPLYSPIEQQSYGLKDELLKIEIKILPSDVVSLSDLTPNESSSGTGGGESNGDGQELPDVVFSDLREFGCFTAVRDQGDCGSCYAMAFTFFMEWLYCKKTGHLVAFSEQYMLDCGTEYVAGIDGCNGGTRISAAYFVYNFGLELYANYPYVARADHCPYAEYEPLNTTGYIRPDFGELYRVHLDRFAEILKKTPILVTIKFDQTFAEYGGGVDVVSCKDGAKNVFHGAVVIGHGRENGEEYWLIRNSHSLAWGEQGYYKLAKTAGCINGEIGSVYGTKDGINVVMNVDINPRHDERRIKDVVRKPVIQETTTAPTIARGVPPANV